MKMREYGNPSEAQWQQKSLSDVACILETLCERECDYADAHGANIYGKGPLAIRLDLVEKARELINVAESSNKKIMREVWEKVCNRSSK